MAHQDIFFSLLRSGLYGTPLPQSELPDRIDWKGVVALARRHAVLGIIATAIPLLPASLRPSGPEAAAIDRFSLGLIRTNLILDRTAAKLTAFLRSHGLDGVLLKGQGVARYYRSPQMRHCGDIDFYVGRKIFRKASSLCRDGLSDDSGEYGETVLHSLFSVDGVRIELHRLASIVYSPLGNRRFQRWTEEELLRSPSRRSVTVGDTAVTLPSYDFDAIFIFYHAWLHFIMGGIGLRQLCDWAMIFHTHAGDIDSARLAENIRRFGMTKGWKLFACIVVKCLGVPEDRIPLYDPSYRARAEKILEEIVTGGNFGYYSEAHAREKNPRSVLAYALNKARSATGYFISLFPLIPLQATVLYLNRLWLGGKACIQGRRARFIAGAGKS